MTHDIPRFGTPDGGLTWASTGTHHGGPALMALAMAGQFPQTPADEEPTAMSDSDIDSAGPVVEIPPAPFDALAEEPRVTDLIGIDPDMTAGRTPKEHLARAWSGDEPFDEVQRLRAEFDAVRALVRTVDLYGTGYVWTDRATGKKHMLNPIDVDVLIGAEHQTRFERLIAERDAARVEMARLRARIEPLVDRHTGCGAECSLVEELGSVLYAEDGDQT